MTITTSLALFFTMVILALLPGPGILAVIARTLTSGFRHGLSTVAGIVTGDYVFIALALFGLATLSELMGSFFIIVKFAGAAYLIYLGIRMILSKGKGSGLQACPANKASHLSSYAAGLLTTLGNPKAILFYLSFFPAFLDLSQVSVLDVWVLYITATLAVGGVMYGYAWLAHKAKNSFRLAQTSPVLRFGSGALLVGSGAFIAARS